MSRYELRAFAMAEAEMVSHWAATPDDVWKLTGSEEFPLTADHIIAWTFESDFAFTLRRDGDLVAYGEIVIDPVEQEVEIQHVLVAPDMRRLGIGKAMTSRLCAFLAATTAHEAALIRIGRDNEPALRCVAALGFQEQSALSGPRYQWLKITLTREPQP